MPRVSATTPDYDIVADGIVLNLRELTPKQIHLETLTKVHDRELEAGTSLFTLHSSPQSADWLEECIWIQTKEGQGSRRRTFHVKRGWRLICPCVSVSWWWCRQGGDGEQHGGGAHRARVLHPHPPHR